MRILLLGATDLTLAVGKALLDMGVSLVGVVTVPKNFSISYASKGVTNTRKVELSEWCIEKNVPFSIYNTSDDILSLRDETNADFALLAGWYHMVPEKVRNKFSLGCVGLHASLLPKYRGGAPLNWALLNREKETGISLIELDDGVDTGRIYNQKSFFIKDDAYIEDIIYLIEEAAIDLIKECLPRIVDGSLLPVKQDGEASYGLQRRPEDGCINWTDRATNIACLIRAVSHPYPGAYTYLDGEKIIIWRGKVVLNGPVLLGMPGQFVRFHETGELLVITGDGLLCIEEAKYVDGGDALNVLNRASQRHFDTN